MKINFGFKVLFATCLLNLCPSLNALNTISWVSGVGNDSNPCSRTAPCLTLEGAYINTSANGQISAIDPGNFFEAGFTIMPGGLTIDCSTIPAEMIVQTGVGITVLAGSTDTFVIRHLSFNGENIGAIGIEIATCGTVVIEDCEFIGLTNGVTDNGAGIQIANRTPASVVIRNCTFSNCGNGINILPNGADLNVLIDNCKIADTNIGILIAQESTGQTTIVDIQNSFISNAITGVDITNVGTVNTSILNTTIQGCVGTGIQTTAYTNIANSVITECNSGIVFEGTNTVNCVGTLFSNCAFGIQVDSDSTLRISNNDFYNITTPISTAGTNFTVATANNNRIVAPSGGATESEGTTAIIFQ